MVGLRRGVFMRVVCLGLLSLILSCVPESNSDEGGGEDQGVSRGFIDAAEPDATRSVQDAAAEPDLEVDACVPSGEETCNGADDDCDGNTDEGFNAGDACEAGIGGCLVRGSVVCVEDGTSACDAVAGAGEVETCNEIDDDCDGTVDEGFPDLGRVCDIRAAECLSQGVIVCAPDGATICSAPDIVLGDELCGDEIDNDCDGLIDEGFDLGELCEAGEGLCRRGGFTICGANGLAECDAVPGPVRDEACNGFDDDCDGIPDEDFGGGACTAGVGACAVDGFSACDGEGEIVCDAVAGDPSPEACNDIDDDCDGEVDETFVEQLGMECSNGVGACGNDGTIVCDPEGGGGLHFEGIRQNVPQAELEAGGFEICWSGTFNAQSNIAAILQACNGGVLLLGCRPVNQPNLALAAMGQRDEVLTDTGNGRDAVHNHNGVDWYFNNAHSWGFAPQGAGVARNSCDTSNVQPQLRMCWHTSNGNVTNGYRCGQAGNGNANMERLIMHRAAGAGVICDAEPANEPEPEACNGADDDCDGETDEQIAGVGEACDGIELRDCEHAIQRCTEEGLGCVAEPRDPQPESCNEADDDCDGEVDEDFADLGEACMRGDGACQNEGVMICDPEPGGLPFAGVQQNLAEADLLALGFERCHASPYNQNAAVAPILEACNQETLVLACRPANNPTLTLAAAGLREEVTVDAGRQPAFTNQHNGVGWYWSDNYSIGFAPGGLPVNRNSCDVAAGSQEQRMCWHSSGGNLTSGHRCGNAGGGGGIERLIYQRPNGQGTTCSVEAREPEPETCNGDDDDCDGTTDEEIQEEGMACEDPRLNACEVGIHACVAGRLECFGQPGEGVPEVCNNEDDDCDGATDEDWGNLNELCNVGVGECERLGIVACNPDAGPAFDRAGITQDVPTADIAAEGFVECWRGSYGGETDLDEILAACDGEILGMACQPSGAANYTLFAAGERGEVLTDTGNGNNVNAHNGVGWYFNNSHSWGFAPEGLEVDRRNCDLAGAQGEQRLCWNTNGNILAPGFRCGETVINAEEGWDRVLLHRPAGGGEPTICDATPGAPGNEVCNELDDDCDGLVDEGRDCPP